MRNGDLAKVCMAALFPVALAVFSCENNGALRKNDEQILRRIHACRNAVLAYLDLHEIKGSVLLRNEMAAPLDVAPVITTNNGQEEIWFNGWMFNLRTNKIIKVIDTGPEVYDFVIELSVSGLAITVTEIKVNHDIKAQPG